MTLGLNSELKKHTTVPHYHQAGYWHLNSEVKEDTATLCWYFRSNNPLCRHPLIVGLQHTGHSKLGQESNRLFSSCALFLVVLPSSSVSLFLKQTLISSFSPLPKSGTCSLSVESLCPPLSLSFFLSLFIFSVNQITMKLLVQTFAELEESIHD